MRSYGWDPQPGDKGAAGLRTVHDRIVEATPGFIDAEHWSTRERIAHRTWALTAPESQNGYGLTYPEIREALNIAPKVTTRRVGLRVAAVAKGVRYTDGLPNDWVETELHQLYTKE